MDQIKVGFVGAGTMANKVHYPSLASFSDVKIVAICDLDETKLNETANKYEVENCYKDYKTMLEKTKLDAIYIIMAPVPSGTYANAEPMSKIVIECLRRGLSVFIEKPPGTTVEETRKMAEEAKKHECKTMVGFNRRFIPVFRKAKEIVESRGEITHCTAVFHKNAIGQQQPWGKVSYLIADVIHAIDALRFMGGEVEKVFSYTTSFYEKYLNSFNALLVFKNGCVGHLCSNYSSGSRVHYFEMHSKGIYAIVDAPLEPPESQLAYILRDNQSYNEAETIKNIDLVKGNKEFHVLYGYLQENRHFIDCVKEDKEPETSLLDAIKTMELVEKIASS
ncbi:MAG: Gfo/Idh/MocA family oxidoreductase [Thermoproteota archaeon]